MNIAVTINNKYYIHNHIRILIITGFSVLNLFYSLTRKDINVWNHQESHARIHYIYIYIFKFGVMKPIINTI